MPRRIFADVSPTSIGGRSLFQATAVTAENVVDFTSEDRVIAEATARLRAAGFDVLNVSPTTINISGTARQYREAFGTELVAEERAVLKPGNIEDTATFVEAPETDQPGFVPTEGTALGDVLEGVAIEEPRYPMAPSAFPPRVGYWHLDVPADVSLATNADRAHRSGITGRGVTVVMTDSGWEPHPYFVQRGYRFMPTIAGPGATNPGKDENGHGTSESANIFAVAPDVDFQMVKIDFANTTAGFNAAVARNPDIISNSWGSSVRNPPLSAADLALAAAIATAVANGIVVVFAAGNGHWGFPGQHPDVISAGGVYVDADGSMRASDYASGFVSNIYPGRQSPDVCGLVGMQPGARYIMLPLPAGCEIDTGGAGGTHPEGDETGARDGWAAISGTSAACPQLAGVAALIRQACPALTPVTVRSIMRNTARDVTAGSSHPNTPGTTGSGPDTATGHGLVDAHKAVLSAKLRGLSIRPQLPVRPGRRVRGPMGAAHVAVREAVTAVGGARGRVAGPGDREPVGFTDDDIAYLERMIVESGDDLGR